MDKPSRVRLRLLALFLPLTAVLYIGAEALNPKGTDRLVNTVAAGLQVRSAYGWSSRASGPFRSQPE